MPIPYGRQSIDADDISAVAQALGSAWLTQGPRVGDFERALCELTGAAHAVAVANGTAALHLCMMALGLGAGDRLVTSPITFAASANCALYVGARPQFVDIDDGTYHMDVARLARDLNDPKRRAQVRVVVPVHFMGTVSDIVSIREICASHGIAVVEDAAHALGAKYKVGEEWLSVGCCRHSDLTIFSFHPIKHITTGEGGAVLTNDSSLHETLLRLRHHGINKQAGPVSALLQEATDQAWFYDISQVGFNYRITDFQCALGISQLRRLDAMVCRRRDLVRRYNESFGSLPEIRTPSERESTEASYHLYVIRVPASQRNSLFSYLRRKEIHAQVNYIPTHLFSYYQRELGYRDGDLPVAEKFFRECLSLPLYPALSDADQDRVIAAVREFFGYE